MTGTLTNPLSILGTGLLAPEGPAVDGGLRVEEPPAPVRFDARALRRTSRLGRLALAACEAALTEAGCTLQPGGPDAADTGLVVGTSLADLDETTGFLGGLHRRGARFASPQNFQRSVHGAVAGELAILYGLTGYNLTVSEGLRSGEAALFAAALAIAAGRARRCLVVAVDGLSPVLLDVARALNQPAPLGEGAAALLLGPPGLLPDGPHLRGVDLVQTQATRPSPRPRWGLCGAAGLMQTVAAVRSRGQQPAPAGVSLGPAAWFTPGDAP